MVQNILYVCDNLWNEKPCIDELDSEGFRVASAPPEIIAVDYAIDMLTDEPDEFSLVITGMYMACGRKHLTLERTQNGWNTGLEFILHTRRTGCPTPFLVHDVSTAFWKCSEHIRNGALYLSTGEAIPIVLKDEMDSLDTLISVVRNIIAGTTEETGNGG